MTPAHLKALAHPLRQRLLFELGEHQATISQLAGLLECHKGTVAHHLKVLREAGLVHIAETRHVRGGTEHYYTRTAATLAVPGNPGPQTAALLQAVTAELSTSPTDPLLILRHLHLTESQAASLSETLSRLVAEQQEATPDHPRYAILVSLYETLPGVPGEALTTANPSNPEVGTALDIPRDPVIDRATPGQAP